MWLRVVFWWWLAGLAQGSHNTKEVSCSDARNKCLYRSGCSTALGNYLQWCSDVVGGDPRCSIPCRDALIALTSTEEGKDLMTCTCNDDYCKKTKERVEICKPHVLRATQNETMSCSLSQRICIVDVECATALEYYKKFCRSMFVGKKCSRRCHNSIKILKKQKKAANLNNCKCNGFEDYDCDTVKDNMDRLCYHKVKPKEDVLYNIISDENYKNVASSLKISLVTLLVTFVLVTGINVP